MSEYTEIHNRINKLLQDQTSIHDAIMREVVKETNTKAYFLGYDKGKEDGFLEGFKRGKDAANKANNNE